MSICCQLELACWGRGGGILYTLCACNALTLVSLYADADITLKVGFYRELIAAHLLGERW